MTCSHGLNLSDGSVHEDDIIVVTDDHDDSRFLLVKRIIYVAQSPFVHCERYHVECYGAYHHSYEVKPSGLDFLLRIDDVKYHVIHGLYEIRERF